MAFQTLGIIRLAPLFSARWPASACISVQNAGSAVRRRRSRRVYCSSGAAMEFAWRDYMPTFTDASLIAAGTGAAAMGAARRRGDDQTQDLGRAGRLCRARGRYVRPVQRRCDPRLRGHRGARGVAPTGRSASGERSRMVARVGLGVLRWHRHLRHARLWRSAPVRLPARGDHLQPERRSANLRSMPAHLIQAMPMLVLGLAARRASSCGGCAPDEHATSTPRRLGGT